MHVKKFPSHDGFMKLRLNCPFIDPQPGANGGLVGPGVGVSAGVGTALVVVAVVDGVDVGCAANTQFVLPPLSIELAPA